MVLLRIKQPRLSFLLSPPLTPPHILSHLLHFELCTPFFGFIQEKSGKLYSYRVSIYSWGSDSLMGFKPSFRGKAAHFVSDLATAILNPISDEPSGAHDNEMGTSKHKLVTERDSGVEVDGPDTSSFTAFLASLLSSSESHSQSNEDGEHHAELGELDVGRKRSGGRKSLFARGKRTLSRAIYQGARINGHRDQDLEQKINDNMKSDGKNDSKIQECESQHVQDPKEIVSQSLPDISEPSLLLSENMRSSLYTSLPALVQGRKWVLIYSTWRHGISLSTLYRSGMHCPGYCLLVVGDRKGAVFGGLVEAPLRPTNKKKYRGTNNSFVFTNVHSCPVVYRPTGANRYFTLCTADFLALGGGGHFALYLDGDLLNGSSSASETFGNSCLAHTPDFEVKEVELWGFTYASKYEETVPSFQSEAPGICRW